MRASVLLLLAVALAGCSSILEGTSQEIVVNTNPSAADCGFYRNGAKIGEVASTPGTALIKKTKYDLTVLCVKQGYQQTTYLNHSGVAGATFGNILLGGGVGWAIDSASGADNKYDSPVNLTLLPEQVTPAPTAAMPGIILPNALPTSPGS